MTYWLQRVDADGTTTWLASADMPEASAGLPAPRLTSCHPNPFNPQTEIRFNLARPGDVAIRMHPRVRPAAPIAPSRGTETILVAEDEPSIREVARAAEDDQVECFYGYEFSHVHSLTTNQYASQMR